MNKAEIKEKIERYIKEGEATMNEASSYLHTHADDWDSSRELHWRSLINHAQILLVKALTLKEVLEK